MRKAFTMLELLFAVMLTSVVTVLCIATFNAVSTGWQTSTDYIDKMQRTDYALDQVVTGLRSMYYPHDGEQNANYGFMLTNNGDGENPDDSDIIEWSKIGPAIVGTKSAVADTVHRVQVRVLEGGKSYDFRDADGRRYDIEVTGLYARRCPDTALRPVNNPDEVDYSFGNDEMYEPVLIADGIVGFNCRVLKSVEAEQEGEKDKRRFEDEFAESNAVPYKVELTFWVIDPEEKRYRSNTAPVMRIVRIPIHEQSLDGAATPSEESKDSKNGGEKKNTRNRQKGKR